MLEKSLEPAALAEAMNDLGRRAQAAARTLARAGTGQKNDALKAVADALRAGTAAVLGANAEDVEAMRAGGVSAALIDRGTLDARRIEAMAAGVEAIVGLEDPVGAVIAEWPRPNGLRIERVRTPLGVIGVVYESRPNVTVDAAALCLKSGNAVILRGGSDTDRSNRAIHACIAEGLDKAGLPVEAVQMVPTKDRAAVGLMLAGLDGTLDVIVPRGGKSLVARVQAEARVPVFAHLEGIVHLYVHGPADLAMARDVLVNGKMRRTGICGATETLLVDRAIAKSHVPELVRALKAAGCEVRGDESSAALAEVVPAEESDWSTEYLDSIIALKVVDGLEGALEHITRYSSHHTDAIVTDDEAAAARFLDEVDSAIVMHNASTQFADGGEFGMGAEIGIATGKMHARGPIGVEQLTSFKYRVHGNGQTRPT